MPFSGQIQDHSSATPAANQVRVFNSATKLWTPTSLTTAQLSDFTVTSPAAGDLLLYSGSAWINSPLTLDNLSDVIVSSVATHDELHYTGSNWANTQAWTTYTPTWTAATTNPTIGNGTMTGAYRRRGDTITFRVEILMGSTTTYGTGNWSIALPATASTTYTQIVPLHATDSGTNNYEGCLMFGRATGDGAKGLVIIHGFANAGSATVPHTWAVNDYLIITGSYETNA